MAYGVHKKIYDKYDEGNLGHSTEFLYEHQWYQYEYRANKCLKVIDLLHISLDNQLPLVGLLKCPHIAMDMKKEA